MDIEPDSSPLPDKDCEAGWKTRSPEITRLVDSPGYQMMKVLHTWQKRIRERLVGFDLTNTQFIMLTSLRIMAIDGKPVTQADLAGFLQADKMMVSEVVRTLEKKGYVLRQSHPVDRRAKSLVITDEGIRVVDVALKEAVKFDEEFFSVIGEDKETLMGILKKLQ